MPKEKNNFENKVSLWLKKFGSSYDNGTYQVFDTQKEMLFCKSCVKSFLCKKVTHLEQHEKTSVHQRCIKKPMKQCLINTLNSDNAKDQFNRDLCNALVAANIPWNKLKCPTFKNFLERYYSRHMPNESTIRKNYLVSCYNEAINNIQRSIGEHDVCVIVDETTDFTGRYVANLIVSKLSCHEAGSPYLLASKSLERTNHLTVSRFVNESLAPLRVQVYREKLPDLPLPPEPILTRWGTWIESTIFYADNFENIKKNTVSKFYVVMDFAADGSDSIEKAQNIYKNNKFNELQYIKVYFSILPTSLKKLEEIGLPLTESLQIIENVKQSLKVAPGEVSKTAYEKLQGTLLKNPGYEKLSEIYNLLNGEFVDSNINFSVFKYAPITSCDVKRSFSSLKNVLTEKRTNFTMENLEKYLVCYASAKYQ
ncbi:hypothetical protein RN001_000736 [Aquatica leii]|uniref:DUF659 domain-containing protein n=1 Tax=Aquatica leii TaxID=1421715 RepID=A0AAN7Q9W3_9COLE|nr:hypothetical protein RN001_000736 [Aquatica leii]